MNIMENKRVTAIAALMAVAFIGICYKGYEEYSALQKAKQNIDQRVSLLDNMASSTTPPTAESSRAVEKASKTVTDCAADLSKDFEKYISSCKTIREEKLSAIGFQNRIKELSAAITKEAGDTCRINNGADKLGMGRVLSQLPQESEVPYRNFLASAIYKLEKILIKSGAPSIESVYFEGLPETLSSSSKYLPLNFEISFTARRSENITEGDASTYSVLPQVVNKMIHDGEFFYIITGMAVGTQGNLPLLKSTPDAPAEPQAAEGETPAAEPVQGKAALIIGTPNEEVTVHLNVQVLYFTADSL